MTQPTDCIFCKIARREVSSELVHEDDQTVAFRDLSPQAPVHILVIPKKHFASLNDLGAADEALVGHLIGVAKQLAADENVAQDGYRVVINAGEGGGQTVPHIHAHLLGGRTFRWPPG